MLWTVNELNNTLKYKTSINNELVKYYTIYKLYNPALNSRILYNGGTAKTNSIPRALYKHHWENYEVETEWSFLRR